DVRRTGSANATCCNALSKRQISAVSVGTDTLNELGRSVCKTGIGLAPPGKRYTRVHPAELIAVLREPPGKRCGFRRLRKSEPLSKACTCIYGGDVTSIQS